MFNPTNNLSQQKHANFQDFLGQRIAESFDVLNLGVVRTQKTVQSYGNYRSWNGREGQFTEAEDESGVRTPPLWPGSPPRRPNHYRCLSPASKAQAIERGQRELMELVSKMPESCYELSLRDLVEQPMMEVKQETTAVDKDNHRRKKEGKKKKKKKNDEKKAQISKSGSIDNGGFLLKMIFPVSLGSKKKKKKNDSNSTSNCNSKVSPRSFSDTSAKVEDKEWWKKRISGSSETESCGSSINSRSTKSSRSSSCNSSTSTDSRRHGMGNCCSFIRTRKSDKSE